MITVRPIRVSPRARALWQERGGTRCMAIQFREIGSGGCCSVGAAVSALLVEREQLGSDEWIDLGVWDGIPVVAHRALLPFLEAHSVEIDAGGMWPFQGLRLRSEVDIEMWCLFGDQPFAPPKSDWE